MQRLTPEDLPWLIEMRSDPDVHRYLGGWRKQNPDALAVRMQFYLEVYEKTNLGVCKMRLKDTGELIGTSGLQPLEDTGEIEVGYNLAKRFWRQGFGEECARGWLEYGFTVAGLERIVAVAVPENTGSWRIMEKCGMKYEGTQTHYGASVVVYAISKEEFARSRSGS